jgi:cell division protein FtsQ
VRVAQRGPVTGRDAGEPRPPRRPASSGGRWTAAFFTLTAGSIVAAAVWALLGSSLLVARSVRVTGAPQAQRAEVLEAAGITLGTPLIRIDPAAVARRVERIAQIQSAEVSRDWPATVVIAVRERTPALAVPVGGGFALVDRFGVVVSYVARRPPGMVLLSSASCSKVCSARPAIAAAVDVLHELPRSVRRLVQAVSAPSAGAVTLDLQHGVTVLWGGTAQPAAKAAELAILLRTKVSFFDLSDPGTAVTGG